MSDRAEAGWAVAMRVRYCCAAGSALVLGFGCTYHPFADLARVQSVGDLRCPSEAITLFYAQGSPRESVQFPEGPQAHLFYRPHGLSGPVVLVAKGCGRRAQYVCYEQEREGHRAGVAVCNIDSPRKLLDMPAKTDD